MRSSMRSSRMSSGTSKRREEISHLPESGRCKRSLERAVTSKLAENVVHFTRLLRGAGLRLGPASGLEAIAAASSVDILHRDELFWALHSVLIKRPEDFDLYDQAFRLFWRDPTLVQPVLDELLSHVRVPPAQPISRRVTEAWRQSSPSGKPPA